MGNNLTGEYISNTYQRVTQIISGTLFDGTGSQITALGIGMTAPAYNFDVYGASPFRARSGNHTLYVGDGIFFQGYHYHFGQATTERFRISMEGGAAVTTFGVGLSGISIAPLGYAALYGYSVASPGTGPALRVYSNSYPTGAFTSEWVGMYYSGSTGYLAAGSGSLALSSSVVSITGSLRAGSITGTGAEFTHAILGEGNVDKIAINTYGANDYRIRGFSYAGSLTLAASYLYNGGKIVLYGNTHSTNANNIYMTNRVGINTTTPIAALDVSGSGRITNGLVVTGSLVATSFTGSLSGTSSWAINVVNSAVKIARHDFTGSYSYCGTANSGSLESSPVWSIARIEITTAGNTSTQYAYNVAWSDRYTLIYT